VTLTCPKPLFPLIRLSIDTELTEKRQLFKPLRHKFSGDRADTLTQILLDLFLGKSLGLALSILLSAKAVDSASYRTQY